MATVRDRIRSCLRLACALALSACSATPPETISRDVATASAAEPASTAAVFPLRPSPNARYLVDQNGAPFPVLGDAGWEALHNLDSTDQSTYVTDRTGRGFDAVLVEAIEHKFTTSKPPRDLAGNLPFGKRLDGGTYTGSPNGTTSAGGTDGQYAPDPYTNIGAQSPDFTFPNAAYWGGIDSFISLCAANGVVVFLFPAYVGYAGGDEGWMSEMVANDAVIGSGGFSGQAWANDTKSKLWNYGAWIANRYKSYGNVIWVHGGDYGNNPNNGGVFTTQQKNAVNSVLAGIKSVAGQSSLLHTGHWSRPSLATDIALSAGSFDLEAAYVDASSAQYARSAYGHTPALPAFELEDLYEGNPNAGTPERRFQWWSFLSAIGGYFFGSESLWRFNAS